MLRSFSCNQLPEKLVRFPRRLPGTPERVAVLINGLLQAREPGSKDLIADVVSSCPQVRDLSIPSLALLNKNLKLHPENKGLDKLFVVGDMATIHEAENIASIKRLTPQRKTALVLDWYSRLRKRPALGES